MLFHLHLQDCLHPPTIDLSSSGLKEFQQPEFEGYGVNVNKSVSSSNEIKKNTGAPIIEDWVSDCDEDVCEEMVSDNVQHKSEPKPEQAKQPRKINENPRNNRTNWNEKKTQKLGVGFQLTKKACFVCGSFNHLIKDCNFHDKKMIQKPVMNNVQKGTGHREVRPVWQRTSRTTVLTKSGVVPISTARQRTSRTAAPLSAARPINTAAPKLFVNVAKTKPNVFQKAHSLSRRPFNKKTTLNNRRLNNKVNTAKVNSVNTAKGKRVTSVVGKQGINAGDPQVALKDTGIFDSGCSRHMTGNKSYLTDYQDYDGGFVVFAGSSKGGRITGKGKIKTGKLDFEDVYFVKELKFNLFSVSQMFDKKNSVLFIETECLILSPDFKLPNENQATNDESNMWHMRLGHMNFKTMNKLVRGLPLKSFENDYSCVAYPKGKQHKASFKIIRCDNRTEFKNYEMNQFCGIKGIKRELSNARTPQQNGVAKRKNRTLIEAARTMVLVTKPHNKTPYELLIGGTPIISFMRPFGCPVTILNTLDHLGKFDEKADDGFLVGYSINNKAFRVFNSITRKVEENLHVNFLENKPNVAGSGPEWLFDIDILTNSMNYQPVSAGNRTNGNAGLEKNYNAGQAGKENVPDQEYILLPLLHTSSNVSSNSEKDESLLKDDAGKMNEVRDSTKEGNMNGPEEAINTDNTNRLNTISSPLNTVKQKNKGMSESLFDPLIPDLEDTTDLQDTGIFRSAYDDEYVGAEADLNNLETNMSVRPIPTTRIYKDHPKLERWILLYRQEECTSRMKQD
ncbi:ribonuclease H-like domain-containing protein [Tanacetum coccineum]